MARFDDEMIKDKFGGFHFGSAFFGWLVTAGVTVLLGSLVAAVGEAGPLSLNQAAQEAAQNPQTAGVIGGIALILVLAVAYYAGGYVAGRMSRFDGSRQGFGVWVMGILATILLALAGALLGANFNLLQQVSLPTIALDQNTLSLGGLLGLLIAAGASLVAAMAGGALGARYHTKVDNAYIKLEQDRQEAARALNMRATRAQPTFGERVDSGRDDTTRR
ncbi:MAG: hypothetical protein K0S68_247 [Candidatus Saccharibacteria bacterium]|nr:hypothetical protein [Candidatus Saccharibacteria bacterium]